MWGIKKDSKLKGFELPKRSLEQYATSLSDALSVAYILQEVCYEITEGTTRQRGSGLGSRNWKPWSCLPSCRRKVLYRLQRRVDFYEIDPAAYIQLLENCTQTIDDSEASEKNFSEYMSGNNVQSVEQSLLSSKLQGKISAGLEEGDEEEEEEETKNIPEEPADMNTMKKPICRTNLPDYPPYERPCFSAFNCDLLSPETVLRPVDVVVMNPPFGINNQENTDIEFLKQACKIARQSIYFIHKLARTKTLATKAKEMGRKQRVLWRFYFEIPLTAFDKKDFTSFMGQGKPSKGKDASSKNRFSQKKTTEFVRCCLIEWKPA